MKKKTNHTPGPWEVDIELHEHVGMRILGILDSKGNPIVHNCCEDSELTEEDALIIAAAPELLEALKVAANALNPEIPDSWRARIEATIAKAEGRS